MARPGEYRRHSKPRKRAMGELTMNSRPPIQAVREIGDKEVQ